MNFKRNWYRGFCAAILAFPCWLGQAKAEQGQFDWPSVLMARSDYLKLFAFAQTRPVGSDPYIASLQASLGLDRAAGAPPDLISASAYLFPKAVWDGNVNGGFPGSTILVGGIPFTIDPAERATQGLVLGLTGTASARFFLDPGLTLSAEFLGSAARAPSLNTNVLSATGQICARQFLGHEDWLRTCVGMFAESRDLSETDTRFLSLEFGKLVSSNLGPSEVSATLRHSFDQAGEATSLSLSAETIRYGVGVFDATVDLGENVSGRMNVIYGARVGWARQLFGNNTRLSVGTSYSAGVNVFDVPRQDVNTSVNLAMDFKSGISVLASLGQNNSTVPAYSGSVISVSIDFSRLFLD